MAPKAALLESALVDAAHEIFRTDPDNLTVNAVRNHVEDQLGLKAGFFKADTWKSKSKELITTTANKLLDDGEGEGKQASEEDKEDRRDKKTEKKTKRTKQQQAVRKALEKDASEVDDGSVSPEAKLPSQKRKPAKNKITTDSREGQEEYSSDDTKKSTRKRGDGDEDKPVERGGGEEPFAKRKKTKLGEEAPKPGTSLPLDNIDNGSDVPGPKSKPKQGTTKATVAVDAGAISDGSSTSVLDDTPPPKRKSKPSKQASAKPATQKGTAATDSPDEAEVKKLQGQLAKCGVRKIWGFELKRFGDDVKAKIRHLKSMLRDAGMDGRFSEAKAREIKERRELMADLEEVQEMNRNWGVNGSGRASRSRADERGIGGDTEDEAEVVAHGSGKTKSNGHGDSKEKEGADDDDDDGPKVRARGRQSARQADLAFLGSDSESD